MSPANDTKKAAGPETASPTADIAMGEVHAVMQEGVEQWRLSDKGQHDDVAYALFEESLQMNPAERDILAKRVLRKLDLIVLPMVRWTAADDRSASFLHHAEPILF